MRRYINKYGVIKEEYKRPKDGFYTKGSYYASFDSDKLDMFCCIGHINQYCVYKSIIELIKEQLIKS